MRNFLWLLLALCMMAFFTEPASAQRKASKRSTHKTIKAKKSKKGKSAKALIASPDMDRPPAGAIDLLEESESGTINWTEQYIEAYGEANLDKDRFKNPDQAHALALRAAGDEAKQNLLELVKDLFVTPTTTVEDLITTNQGLDQRITQLVGIAVQTELPPNTKGTVHVRHRLALYAPEGLAPLVSGFVSDDEAVLNAIEVRQEKGVSAKLTHEKGNLQPLKGLVLHVHGLKPQVVLFPQLQDSSGRTVLNLRSAYFPDLGKFPKLYAGKVQAKEDARLGIRRVDVVSAIDGQFRLSSASIAETNWAKVREALTRDPSFFFQFL